MSLLQTAKAETNKRPACEPSASALGMFSSECGQYEHFCCSATVKVSRRPPCHKVPSGACRQLSNCGLPGFYWQSTPKPIGKCCQEASQNTFSWFSWALASATMELLSFFCAANGPLCSKIVVSPHEQGRPGRPRTNFSPPLK